MKSLTLKNLKLSTKFFLMIGVSSLLVSFLFGTFYFSFRKHHRYSEGVGVLHGLNQHFLEATVQEKVFLKDAAQSSLTQVDNSITQAKTGAHSLKEYRLFVATDIDALLALLERYSSSFQDLSKVVLTIAGLDGKIADAVSSFGGKSNDMISLINEYESECQVQMEQPDRNLIALRDVARNSLVAVGEVFSILKNDLFHKGDLTSYAANNAAAIKKLKTGKDNSLVIKNGIVNKFKEKEYPDYINCVAETYEFLSRTTSEIHQLSGRKLEFERQFDRIRNDVAAGKTKMLSTGEEQVRLLERNVIGTNFIVFCATLLVVIFGGFFLMRSLVKPINRLVNDLNESAEQVASASGQVSSASQQLSDGASQQAASLEETSSSLDEMGAMTRQNADNANRSDSLMKEANQQIARANDSMSRLTTSMLEIRDASEKTSKIIKTIDEIAFQTNLLALNAAVEAARAGEAGAGFAVVAGEVRNLSMRAADAARQTAELIEGTVSKVNRGSELVSGANENFSEVGTGAAKVAELVTEIAAASNEQAQGIEQVGKAVAEMDSVVQRTAASAEESASFSEEMRAQAERMKGVVKELVVLVHGGDRSLLEKDHSVSREESGRS